MTKEKKKKPEQITGDFLLSSVPFFFCFNTTEIRWILHGTIKDIFI